MRVSFHPHGHPTVDHGVELGQVMIRLGLCCMFRDQPIKFVTMATANGKMLHMSISAMNWCIDL